MKKYTSLSGVKAAAVCAGVAAVSPQVSRAAALAVNFGGDGYGAFGQAVTAAAYGVPVSGWSPLQGSAGTEPSSAVPTASVISGLTFGWTAANDWAQASALSGSAGPAEVNFGYLDDGGAGVGITITGLSAWLATNGASSYSIQVVNSTDNGNSFGPTGILTASGGTLLGTLTNPLTWAGGANAGATTTLSGLTSDTLFIDGASGVGGQARAGIAAVILTPVPEPGVMALGGIAALAMVRRSRRRA
jgi:hypothetical protein